MSGGRAKKLRDLRKLLAWFERVNFERNLGKRRKHG
jgi:hypothetical protein